MLDLGILAHGFMGHPPGWSQSQLGSSFVVTFPFLIPPSGLTRSSSQPFPQSPQPALSPGAPIAEVISENDGSQLLTLAPGRQRCFSDTLGTFPTVLGRNHRMARPQESACLKESNPPLCCPRSGPGEVSWNKVYRQLLDLITRKSAPHLNPSTLPALHCRNVTLAEFSATPSFLADTRLGANLPPSLCTSRITGQLKETVRLLSIY